MNTEQDKLKQVIVMRSDLKMTRGKWVAQGSHASMAFLSSQMEFANTSKDGTLNYNLKLSPDQSNWFMGNAFTKVCVRVDSEKELDNIYVNAVRAGLNVQLITDSGRTMFHGVPTKTCLAIGPHPSSMIDPITGELKLL